MTHDTVSKRLLAWLPAAQRAVQAQIAVLAALQLARRASETYKRYYHTQTFLHRDRQRPVVAPDTTLLDGSLAEDSRGSNFDRYDEITVPLDAPMTMLGNHDVPDRSSRFTSYTPCAKCKSTAFRTEQA